MKKVLVTLILTVLVVGLVISGCTTATPTPAPTPTPTPTPTIEEPFEVNILTSAPSSGGYTFGFALSEIVNKAYPELKLAALEGKSLQVNATVYAEEPEKRKNHIFLTDSVMWSRVVKGKEPFATPAPGLKLLICHNPAGSYDFLSYDPDITRPMDLKGKTIALAAVFPV